MFSLFVACRYLLSRKRHHTTGVISAISVAGVALATAAMVVTLSVFNGFRDMVASFFTAFDAELKVSPTEGKTLAADDPMLVSVRNMDAIEVCTEVLEDQALIVSDGRQWVVTVKGVSDNFTEQADFEGLLYGDGELCLHADVLEYGVLGIRLAAALGLGTYFEGALPVYAPRRGERVNMANPLESFVCGEIYSPGVVFAVNQGKYDSGYVLTSIGFARRLFDQPDKVSALELKLRKGEDVGRTKSAIRAMLGERFRVEDRYEQQADTFRIMQVEKLIAYMFLTFILLVASLNIVGSLSMLMLEKRDNVATLRALGADERQLSRIFFLSGWLISALGAALGVAMGLALCWAQMRFGWVRLGNSEGSFVVDAYPVSVHAWDLVVVFVTVAVTGLVAVGLPVRRMMKGF